MKIDLKKHNWVQISGDMNPSQHGGMIARCDGCTIEIIDIQPVREFVGDREAIKVGFPFWTKEACFTRADLSPDREEVQAALQCCGLTKEELEKMKPAQRSLAIAECLVYYGHADEGPCGYSKDILGNRRVRWSGCKKAQGWRYLADEDREFKRLLKESR